MCVHAHICECLCICKCCLGIYRCVWVDAGTYTPVDVECVYEDQTPVMGITLQLSCIVLAFPTPFSIAPCFCAYMFCICMNMHAEA